MSVRLRFVIVEKLAARDGWRCHLCGERIVANTCSPNPRCPTIDHVVPKSKGGSDRLENLKLAHKECNQRRGNADLEAHPPMPGHERSWVASALSDRARHAEAVVMMVRPSSDHSPWSRAELEREVAGVKGNPLDVTDAVNRLYSSGLVHLSGELVTATRAARRMDELQH
jgi:hypothetical protein